MYQVNNLKREILITPDEVIFHAATDQIIDERSIKQNIIVAEERFIANILGNNFYEDFISQKNLRITSENKITILQQMNEYFESEGIESVKESDLKIGMIINSLEFVQNQWYRKLWERFLWKLTAECVDAMMIIPSWLRSTAEGQQKNKPAVFGGDQGGSASGEAKDVQLKLTSAIQDRINPLVDRMRLWICQNKHHFPLYNGDCSDCGCQESESKNDGISYVGKSNFITGIYED